MRGRKGSNKTHSNENQKGGWYRSSDNGYTTYVKRTESSRQVITKNHKFLYGTKYHNNSTFWVCDWAGTKKDGSKWHYIMVFHSLKAAKELQEWRNCLVKELNEEE